MILPLRRRHRTLWTVLAFALPALFVVALSGRRPVPAMPEPGAGAELRGEPSPPALEPWSGAGLEFGWTASPDGAIALELRLRAVPERPDLILYWRAAGAPALESAVLLGALGRGPVRRVALPEAVPGGPGELVLYSLGHGEIVTTTPVVVPSPRPGDRPAAAAPEEGGR